MPAAAVSQSLTRTAASLLDFRLRLWHGSSSFAAWTWASVERLGLNMPDRLGR